MSHVRTCAACNQLVIDAPASCPHCQASLGRGPVAIGAAAALMGLALIGCGEKDSGSDSTAVALYGVPDSGQFEDADGDGFSGADGDCDDGDAAINPDATETAGDGVDSNCDGADDT